jgi:hypothetical protein
MTGLRVAAIPTGVGDQVNVAVGTGRNREGVVQVYPGTSFGGTGEPGGSQVIDPFGGIALTDGVFVGYPHGARAGVGSVLSRLAGASGRILLAS